MDLGLRMETSHIQVFRVVGVPDLPVRAQCREIAHGG